MKETPDLNDWTARRTLIKKAWTAAERENDNAGHTFHTTHDDALDRLMAGVTCDQDDEITRWARSKRYLG